MSFNVLDMFVAGNYNEVDAMYKNLAALQLCKFTNNKNIATITMTITNACAIHQYHHSQKQYDLPLRNTRNNNHHKPGQ